ncbi:MAG: ccmE [Ilumatobacteraceae bacterium]|nr:ccmE [Ilumatobacteraceae bacterium]
MDLSPRIPEQTPSAPRVRNRRTWLSIGLLVLVLAAGGVVLTKFLTTSLDYYCNVDEVGHKSGCENGRRLRIQGTVDEGTLKAANGVTTFDISFNKATIPVVYQGDPGGLFQECIPVVVHGEMQGGVFNGDEVEVKHSSTYEAKNPDRISTANKESAACLQLKQ